MAPSRELVCGLWLVCIVKGIHGVRVATTSQCMVSLTLGEVIKRPESKILDAVVQ